MTGKGKGATMAKARDWKRDLDQLRKDCMAYGPAIGPRLFAYVADNGLAMDALCERAEKLKRRRNAFGVLTPVPSEELLGVQGMAWQIGPNTLCELLQFELGTDGNKKCKFGVRFGMHVAWTFHGKRSLRRIRQEADRRGIVAKAKATAWDIGAALKFNLKALPRRCAVVSMHSKVAMRRGSDRFPLAAEEYRPVFFVDRGSVSIRGVREDEMINGPVILLGYGDSVMELFPM